MGGKDIHYNSLVQNISIHQTSMYGWDTNILTTDKLIFIYSKTSHPGSMGPGGVRNCP